jgi:hypothetical protein
LFSKVRAVPGNDEKEMMDSEVSRPRDHDGDTFDVVVSFVMKMRVREHGSRMTSSA